MVLGDHKVTLGVTPTYPSTWVDLVGDECSTWQPIVEACFLVAAQEQSSCHLEGQTSTDTFLDWSRGPGDGSGGLLA